MYALLQSESLTPGRRVISIPAGAAAGLNNMRIALVHA